VSTYDDLGKQAEKHRNHWRTPLARRFYERALGEVPADSPEGCHCQQMIGVCYIMEARFVKRRAKRGIEWLMHALTHASSVREQCNILRDIARAYMVQKEYDKADDMLSMALAHLSAEEYPAEHAITVGFMARLRALQGYREEAIDHFEEADTVLKVSEPELWYLFNKLPMAWNYLNAGYYGKGGRSAQEALMLSKKHKLLVNSFKARWLLLRAGARAFQASWSL
jgi:tetratricopeptide (TPR) repeat protein